MRQRIEAYLGAVCDQIRWKRAHRVVSEEMENHIGDQAEAYAAGGMTQEAALEASIREMGDPVVAGQMLDRAHRPKPDWGMLALIGVLVALGSFLQYTVLSLDTVLPGRFLIGHVHFIPIGLAVLAGVYFLDYSIVGKAPKTIFVAWVVIWFAIWFFGGGGYYGNYNYARFIYYIALLMIPAFAGVVYDRRQTGIDGVLFCGGFYALGAYACLASRSFSAVLMYSLACFVILIAAIAKGWFRVNKAGAFALVFIPTALTIAGVLRRSEFFGRYLDAVLHPEAYPRGEGYITLAMRDVLANARLWGETALSRPYSSLENAADFWSTNYILSFVVLKFGLLAGAALVLLFAGVLARMFWRAFGQKSSLGFIVSFACAAAVGVQFVMYVLANFGILLVGGTLPFVSFGGLGFLTNMILFGIFLSAVRHDSVVRDKVPVRKAGVMGLYSFAGGRVVIDLRRERG